MTDGDIQTQAATDANIFPLLTEILQKAEFHTIKKSALAVTYVVYRDTPEHIRYLVALGCIELLCNLLTAMNSKIVPSCFKWTRKYFTSWRTKI